MNINGKGPIYENKLPLLLPIFFYKFLQKFNSKAFYFYKNVPAGQGYAKFMENKWSSGGSIYFPERSVARSARENK